jgi:hypothetical protein
MCSTVHSKELSFEVKNGTTIDAATEEVTEELSMVFDEYFKSRMLNTLPKSSTI